MAEFFPMPTEPVDPNDKEAVSALVERVASTRLKPRRHGPLSVEDANRVYDVLVEECDAPESMREHFVVIQTREVITEYRFQGSLGFGGKFWNRWDSWDVTCYPEDLNSERRATIDRANERLEEIRG